MSKNAVMPLSDYVSVCDTIREKIPDIVLVDKTIYREQEGSFTETLVAGMLIEGEQYLIKYTDTGLGNIDEGGIYSASLVNVPNVGSALGMAVILKHPVSENATHTIYVYQSGVDIMLYVDDVNSAEHGSVSISVIATTGKIVSGELPEKINEVYEAGQTQGEREMWDCTTNSNTRENYNLAFGYSGFEYIRPPYQIKPKNDMSANQTFIYSKKLKKVEADYFDFSQKQRGTYNSGSYYYTFNSCSALEEVEDIGIQPDYALVATFGWCGKLKKIAIIRVDENTKFDSAFQSCGSLEEVTFEGVIGQNGLDFSPCTKLSKASWMNIMTKLSPSTTGLSITGSLASVKKAFETSEGANDGDTSDAWLTLCGGRDNWTISLL